MKLLDRILGRPTELAVRGTGFESRSFVAAALPEKKREKPAKLDDRYVPSSVTDAWTLSLPSQLTPKNVESIMRGALMGELWRFVALVDAMRDAWPVFAKCSLEMRRAVAEVNYKVSAFAHEGEEASEDAKAKADCVARAVRGFKPDRFEDEDNFKGMVFDLTDAAMIGASVEELVWHKVASPDGRMEWLPRSASWVHPKNYVVGYNGSIRVNESRDGAYFDPLKFRSRLELPQRNDPSKYLVAKFKSRSGSFLGCGLARSLAWWYCAVVYGRGFALQFAQKYGSPFLDIPYQSGIPKEEVDRLEQLALWAANNGYCVHPNTGEIKVTPAQSMGGENPQVVLMKMADEACQILMLGQTATTQGTAGKLGEDETRGKVRQEYLTSLAGWVAGILTDQFAASVVDENWGEDDVAERPTVVADFTETEDPLAAAQRWDIILRQRGMPVHYEEAAAGLGVQVAEPGDKVLLNGRVGLLGETDVPVDAPINPATGQPFSEDEQAVMNAAQFGGGQDEQSQGGGEDEGGDGMALAARHADKLRRMLVRASDADLDRLEASVRAAEQAPHRNGEVDLVRGQLAELAGGRR